MPTTGRLNMRPQSSQWYQSKRLESVECSTRRTFLPSQRGQIIVLGLSPAATIQARDAMANAPLPPLGAGRSRLPTRQWRGVSTCHSQLVCSGDSEVFLKHYARRRGGALSVVA